MSEWKKPPLGVSPHWFVYNKRIKELNEAIGRYIAFAEENNLTTDTAQYYECIAKWANDISLIASAEAKLLKGENGNGESN